MKITTLAAMVLATPFCGVIAETFDIRHDYAFYPAGEGGSYVHTETMSRSGLECSPYVIQGTGSSSNNFLSQLCNPGVYFGGSPGAITFRDCGLRGGENSYYATAYSSNGHTANCVWASQKQWTKACSVSTTHLLTLELVCRGDFPGFPNLKKRELGDVEFEEGLTEEEEKALTEKNVRLANAYADQVWNGTILEFSGIVRNLTTFP